MRRDAHDRQASDLTSPRSQAGGRLAAQALALRCGLLPKDGQSLLALLNHRILVVQELTAARPVASKVRHEVLDLVSARKLELLTTYARVDVQGRAL